MSNNLLLLACLLLVVTGCNFKGSSSTAPDTKTSDSKAPDSKAQRVTIPTGTNQDKPPSLPVAEEPHDPEARAVATVQKLGGEILRDEKGAGHKVVGVKLGEATDADLKELAVFKDLNVLNLSGSYKVTDAGLKELAVFKDLKELDLSGCFKVTDAGLKELATLKSLQKLNLVNTMVTGAGVAELLKALPKCTISQ
jgi:hypothetical protein